MVQITISNNTIDALYEAVALLNSILATSPEEKKKLKSYQDLEKVSHVLKLAIDTIGDLEILCQDNEVIKMNNAALTRYARYLKSRYGPYIELEKQVLSSKLNDSLRIVNLKLTQNPLNHEK